jgi:hypothetical protein
LKITAIALEVCYPDGTLKRVLWGTSWLEDTAALIFRDASMSEQQTRLFSPKRSLRRRLRKVTWRDRPTLIRQKVGGGQDEPICSIREFGSTDSDGECTSSQVDRGALKKLALHVSSDQGVQVAELSAEELQTTAALLLTPTVMTSEEKQALATQPGAVAIRHHTGKETGSNFDLVCCNASQGSRPDYSLAASCDLRRGRISERA